MFQKKRTCKLCGVKTTATERCPKCGYSFRTVDQLDTQQAEIERRMRDVKYGINSSEALDVMYLSPNGARKIFIDGTTYAGHDLTVDKLRKVDIDLIL